ncbi:MAG: LuxR C-terminal-related transcriptional regulator [Roseiflexus sp.]|nr:LuxR C-terminal-related transcriptional regulator [Roseiflexus sp.]MDW8148431.1 LuxR C-terminal-related transcriptional regulator [Roseiflexaceae bacterium]
MEHHDPIHPPPAPALDVALWCGIPELPQALRALLQPRGWRYAPDAPLLALLDAPFGYALRTLPAAALAHRQVVVVTHNPCPEYWDDLWEFRPAILLVSQCSLPALERALVHAAAGHRYRLTPHGQVSDLPLSPLTAAERAVLRALAHGRTNRQIAHDLRLSERRIANLATEVYRKLSLPGRSAAMLYYWGRWELLATPHGSAA